MEKDWYPQSGDPVLITTGRYAGRVVALPHIRWIGWWHGRYGYVNEYWLMGGGSSFGTCQIRPGNSEEEAAWRLGG